MHEPDRPQLLGQWVSSAAGTHRNFYNGGQWVYATSTLPGFEGQVLAIVDIADPASPKTAGTWWHPGRISSRGLDCLVPNDRHVYLAYFNAGLQIYDISDPHDPHITGFFIPDDPPQRRGPIPSRLVHQAQDVLVDRRGVIYMSEGNSGIYVFTHNPSL